METLNLKRKILSDKTTIGELYGPDGSFWCHTLEDVVRNVKVHKKTAIPNGVYPIVLSWFARKNRLMPMLIDVPFFTGIFIHTGNTQEHTEGCILVGRYDPLTPDFISSSHDAFDRIFPLIRKLVEKGEVALRVEGGIDAGDWVDSLR